MKRSQETALADLTYAASTGQADVTKHLLASGLPIDAGSQRLYRIWQLHFTAIWLLIAKVVVSHEPNFQCDSQQVCAMPDSPVSMPSDPQITCSGDYDGRTALHLAVAEEQVQSVRILLDRGASVDVMDRWGNTPLLEALKLNNRPIAEALVGKGANLRSNAFSLVKDAAENDTGLLQLACTKAGVDPNSCDYDRRSVLHTVCASGDLKAVEALLSVGVDVDCTDRSAICL